jgi:hypothetical protein
MIKNVWNKIRQTNFSVMITADLLTAHFGIHRHAFIAQLQRPISDTVKELVLRCCVCLMTQPVGMESKSTKVAEHVYDTLVMVSVSNGIWGMGNDTCRQYSLSLRFD